MNFLVFQNYFQRMLEVLLRAKNLFSDSRVEVEYFGEFLYKRFVDLAGIHRDLFVEFEVFLLKNI